MPYHCVVIHQKGPIEELVHQDRLFALTLSNQEIGCRFYETHGVILGKLDQTCSNFQEGVEYLHKQGYPTTIREQGGLGVVVDEGVLNVSIILPTSLKPYSGLYEAYDTMVMLFKKTFASYPHKLYFYEIENSYCPGKYDGVIHEKKWCGLAQKRMKDKVIISATIMVNGHQYLRGALMKAFYEIANQNQDSKFPNIDPESMSTLSELMNTSMSTEQCMKLIQSTVKTWVQDL